jgi:hypothetical protein
MKNFIALISTFLILSTCSFAQVTSYPKGGYKTFEEFQKKQPSIPFVFQITRRTNGDIKFNGGVDYKVTSDSIDKSTIKKDIYAISSGDTLYMNCFAHKVQFWYAKVVVEGKYIAFEGGIPMDKNSDVVAAGVAFGPLGGGIAGAHAAMLRYLFVMEATVGKIRQLDRKYLTSLLEPYPHLKNQYLNEQKVEDKETLLKYLKLINSN